MSTIFHEKENSREKWEEETNHTEETGNKNPHHTLPPFSLNRFCTGQLEPLFFSGSCSWIGCYTGREEEEVREKEDVRESEICDRGPCCSVSWWMSLTMSKTASGCASFSAFWDIFFSTSGSGPNQRATRLAVCFELLENTPAPLSTTYGTLPTSCNTRNSISSAPFDSWNKEDMVS